MPKMHAEDGPLGVFVLRPSKGKIVLVTSGPQSRHRI
jgi:hypothetical protein